MNERGAGLHIDFTAKEVEEFLKANHFQIIRVNLPKKTRHIIGNDGGGGVELSDEYITDSSTVIAIPKNGEIPLTLIGAEYQYLPDVVFKRIMKYKLLAL